MAKYILVINGSKSTFDVMCSYFKGQIGGQHYECLGRRGINGLEAIDYLSMYKLDLIIIDFTEHKLDSICFLNYVRSRVNGSPVPIIGISEGLLQDIGTQIAWNEKASLLVERSMLPSAFQKISKTSNTMHMQQLN